MSATYGPRRGSAGASAAAALILALCALALHAASAQAQEVPNHSYVGISAGKFEDPCGIASGKLGEYYVSDYYQHTIRVYDAENNQLAKIEGVDPDDGPCGLAVGPDGVLFVNYWHGEVVRYTPDHYPFFIFDPPSYGSPVLISSGQANGIAVDPVSGDLYVNERTQIARYPAPVEFEVDPERFGSLEAGFGIAYSAHGATAGRVYAADAADRLVKAFEPGVDPLEPVASISGTPEGPFTSLFDASLAVDQTNGHLLVADNTQPGYEHPLALIDEFNEAGGFRGRLEKPIVDSEPVGLAVNPTGGVYVGSGNGSSPGFPGPLPEDVVYAFGVGGASRILAVSKSGAGEGMVRSKPIGIDCGAFCSGEFNRGSVVLLSAEAGPGSVFAGWSGACSGVAFCQVLLDEDAAVNAEFDPAPSSAVAHTSAPSGSTPKLLALGSARASGRTVVLEAGVAAPGTLIATGVGLRAARLRVEQPGGLRLRLRLSERGRRALTGAKAGSLRIAVAITFVPNAGNDVHARRTVTFRAGRG
jgi:DNA-binding beta-propeller fold protein YncE